MKKFIFVLTTIVVFTAAPFVCADLAAEALAAVRRMEELGVKGDVATVYRDYFPKSYQNDIESIVKAFAGKIDGEIFTNAVGLFAALAETGLAKPEYLDKFAKTAHVDLLPVKASEVDVFYNAMKKFAELFSYETLSKGDLNTIFTNPDFQKMAAFLEKQSLRPEYTGSELNQDGSVSITRLWHGRERTIKYKKTEGVWTDSDEYANWDEDIKNTLRAISEIKIDDMTKKQIINAIAETKQALSQAQKAENIGRFYDILEKPVNRLIIVIVKSFTPDFS